MQFHLYKVSGYEEAIMSLRMSKGKFYSWEKAKEIQDLVYAVTNRQGAIATPEEYVFNMYNIQYPFVKHSKITGDYDTDIAEFKRLLGLTMDNAMGHHEHHTLMKYIDISFFTDGLHRGAQDDLDAHAIGFNNRITRFSTRLATIDEVKVSEWYQDKIIPFHDAIEMGAGDLPECIEVGGGLFNYTPFGYVLDKYEEMNHEASIRKDVIRGLIPLGTPGPALWKTDMFNLRYIYKMRGQLTKANPELKIGIEQLADQIEETVPVFGPHFRQVFTDSGKWEHVHKVRTVTMDEWKEYQSLKRDAQVYQEAKKEG